MRRVVCFAVLMLVVGSGAAVSHAASPVIADYVEARTASVFAGACHYNGEVVTAGREAVLAWNVTSGAWHGVDLAGARAVAVVGSDDTLANDSAVRRSELVVDATSDAQVAALTAALRSSYGATLGEIVRVRRSSIRFEGSEGSYRVDAPGFAALSVEAMPDDACCTMPSLVWYSPLARLTGRKVGYTTRAFYAGGGVGSTWERGNENSAFYGRATFGS